MILQHSFILTVLQRVSPERLQKAVNALVTGDMSLSVTRHTATEIRALVKNGDGIEHGTVLTEALATCSCRDSLYRGTVCKHAAAVALSVLRTPPPKQEASVPQFPTF